MVAITSCDHCSTTLRVKDHLIGKAIRCPVCSKPFRVRVGTTSVISEASDSSPMVFEGEAGEETVSPTRKLEDDREFFAQPENPEIEQQVLVKSKKRKSTRNFLSMGFIILLAMTALGWGVYEALKNAAEKAPEIVLDLQGGAELRKQNFTTWTEVAGPFRGFHCRMPAKPEETVDNENLVYSAKLAHDQYGTFEFLVQQGDHPEWNGVFSNIDRDLICDGVPNGNVLSVAYHSRIQNGDTTIHRYVLSSKDLRVSNQKVVVQKFCFDGWVVTSLWIGKNGVERGPEVSYYFHSIFED